MARRVARAPRSTAVPQRPAARLQRPYAPVSVLSEDHVAQIHQTALKVLAEIGMKVLQAEARQHFAAAGAQVSGEVVRFDPAMAGELLKTVPETFTLRARNPERNLHFGCNDVVFSAVGGPAYVMDIDRGRREGTFAEMCDYLRLIQSLNIVHQEGGGPFEPLDLPAHTRHLDIYKAEITLLDKNWQTQTLGRARTIDGIEMGAMALQLSVDDFARQPALMGVINTNSPLQLDIPMAEGLITMAEHGQVKRHHAFHPGRPMSR